MVNALSEALQDLVTSGYSPIRVRWAVAQAARAAARRQFHANYRPAVIEDFAEGLLLVSTPKDTTIEVSMFGRAAARVFRNTLYHSLKCQPARYARGAVITGVVEGKTGRQYTILTPDGSVQLPESEVARNAILFPGDEIRMVALGGNVVSQRDTRLKDILIKVPVPA